MLRKQRATVEIRFRVQAPHSQTPHFSTYDSSGDLLGEIARRFATIVPHGLGKQVTVTRPGPNGTGRHIAVFDADGKVIASAELSI